MPSESGIKQNMVYLEQVRAAVLEHIVNYRPDFVSVARNTISVNHVRPLATSEFPEARN